MEMGVRMSSESYLHELERNVKKLKITLKRGRDEYSRNEEALKLQIIIPFLDKLGWSSAHVKPECKLESKGWRVKVDYCLQVRRRELAVIEVKALGKLDEVPFIRIARIAQVPDIRYVIITDGDRWLVYDISRPLKEALICNWSLIKETSKGISRKALVIANTRNFGSVKC
jgi:predicted type IV restriction endonuclease